MESDDSTIMMTATPDRKKEKISIRYWCNICDKAFIDKPRLKTHHRNAHRASTSLRVKSRTSRASLRLAGRLRAKPALKFQQQGSNVMESASYLLEGDQGDTLSSTCSSPPTSPTSSPSSSTPRRAGWRGAGGGGGGGVWGGGRLRPGE